MAENLIDVRPNQPPVNEHVERDSIADAIAHQRPAVLRFECMFVNPPPIRSANLLIHKPPRRCPLANDRSPTDRETADSQPVIDDSSGAHLDRPRSENL